MALTDVLRARIQGANQSVSVACGALGTIRAQGLTARECAALSHSGDGDRAVLYAASRDLQLAGEALRAEGKLFTPDEIMQFVSDDEAKAGADAVRKLSGADSDIERAQAKQDAQCDPGTIQPLKKQNAQNGSGSTDPESKKKVRPESVQDSGNQSSKVRHKTVQDKNAPNSEEIRRPAVQSRKEAVREIRPETVHAENGVPSPRLRGQDSREFFAENRPGVRQVQKGQKSDKNPQTVVFARKPASQNVGNDQSRTKTKSAAGVSSDGKDFGRENDLKTKANASDRGEVHEIKSDLSAGEAKLLHDIMSEFGDGVHETKSEMPDTLHESKSEMPNMLHEMKSESDENSREALHEMKSEFADFALRELLEGLRRAKRVR